MKLRDYQVELINKVRFSLKTNRRILMQLPTGGGKTACSTYMVKTAHERGLSTLFCVHRQELMYQAHRTYDQFNIPHGFIAAGIPNPDNNTSNIAMIDTLRRRLDSLPIPKLVVVDEAHHASANSWSKVINHFYSQGSIIVGLSATPQRLDGRPLGNLFDDLVCGPSVAELVNLGCLSPYKYYAPPPAVDLRGLKKRYGDYDQKQLSDLLDKPIVFGDAIKHYKNLLSGKKAIAFNVNIQSSKNFASQCELQGIKCVHVDGDTPSKEREHHIKNFENGDIDILSNVNLFGEGFDVKNCEGVILLRKTASLSLYLQMVGRMMRPCEGKTSGIILDHVNNVAVHGLPDENREWSLTGITRNKQLEDEENISIRQCPLCYYVYRPQKECPKCGHVTPVTKRELEQIETELQEIKERQKRTEVGKARSLEDLRRIAHERGYDPKWANIVFNSRRNRNG